MPRSPPEHWAVKAAKLYKGRLDFRRRIKFPLGLKPGENVVHVKHKVKIAGKERTFSIIFGKIQRTKELGDRPHATVILDGGEEDTRKNFPDILHRPRQGSPPEGWLEQRFEVGYAVVKTTKRWKYAGSDEGDHPGGDEVEVHHEHRRFTVEELAALARIVKKTHAALVKAQQAK